MISLTIFVYNTLKSNLLKTFTESKVFFLLAVKNLFNKSPNSGTHLKVMSLWPFEIILYVFIHLVYFLTAK